jgi:hypothetical protein
MLCEGLEAWRMARMTDQGGSVFPSNKAGFLLATLMVGVCGLAGGCQLLVAGAVLMGPPKQKVKAEFNRLEGKKVLILAWAEPETLIEYPYARFEVARYVGDKIQAHVPNVTVVGQREVEDYLEQLYDAEYDPEKIGKRFEAELVVYMELLEYEMRDPHTPQLYRGKIHSSVWVYDMPGKESDLDEFELEEAFAQVPEGENVVGVLDSSGLEVRKMTYEKFAELVARKFYDHEIEVE